jgi:methyl-accepting chemotaxis protein
MALHSRNTIKGQAQMSGIIFSALIFAITLCSLIGGWMVHNANREQVRLSEFNAEVIAPLRDLSMEIRLNVVQIQQWLTDISATRSQDGLDDGFDMAKEHLELLRKDLDMADGLARRLGNEKLIASLKKVKADHPEYYETGKAMAEAYVAGGPAEGNKMMAGFDSTAEAIGHNLEEIEKVIILESASILFQIRGSGEATANAVVGTILSIVIIGAISLLVAFLQARTAMRGAEKIATASEVLREASKGNLDPRILHIRISDEIGGLCLNVNRLLDLVESFSKEAGAAMEYAGERKFFRKIVPTGMRGEFVDYSDRVNKVIDGMARRRTETQKFANEKVAPSVALVVDEARKLLTAAEELARISDSTIERSITVASAAEEATVNVQTVASASEELSASISEINRQTTESSRIAIEAVTEVKRTNATVSGLNAAAEKIGEVVGIIQDIAEQTNLLALNATIEAARAGEAGKGFAVVAGEVKNLANQTAKATEEITAQVSSMQSISSATVEAIQRIGDTITNINNNVEVVTDAMKEQTAATTEISRSVQEASTGTQEVSASISNISGDAQKSDEGAKRVVEISRNLSESSDKLTADLDEFMVDVG